LDVFSAKKQRRTVGFIAQHWKSREAAFFGMQF